jgi:hypothetical protein
MRNSNIGPEIGLRITAIEAERPQFFDIIENLFYELKPYLIVGLAIWASRAHLSNAGWFKLSCISVMLYGVLVFFARASYREGNR